MKRETIEAYEGKRVKILLNNGFRYKGHVKKIDDDDLILVDKFGLLVSIHSSEINLIIEEEEK